MKKVLILGKGRIGKAVKYYLKKYDPSLRVSFLSSKTHPRNFSTVISALPGNVGEMGLKLALKFKKDLIDISDIESEFYLRNKKKIEKKKILVVPGCGFSPGLTNFICGRQTEINRVGEIEIAAGTLSPKKNFFPFLWCFEDLIEGHTSKATLIKAGKKTKVAPFSDLRQEKIGAIEAESYLGEGLTSLPHTLKIKNMSYRILRPAGFYNFFEYFKNYEFFKKENIAQTKRALEAKKEDNLTVGVIKIKTSRKEIVCHLKSFSKKNEKLNSMQKITSVFPAALTKIILEGDFPQKGLFFPEQLGKNKRLFEKLIRKVRKEITVTE